MEEEVSAESKPQPNPQSNPQSTFDPFKFGIDFSDLSPESILSRAFGMRTDVWGWGWTKEQKKTKENLLSAAHSPGGEDVAKSICPFCGKPNDDDSNCRTMKSRDIEHGGQLHRGIQFFYFYHQDCYSAKEVDFVEFPVVQMTVK